MRNRFGGVVSCVALVCAFARPADGATITFYQTLATFSAAAGGPLLLQDFEGFVPPVSLSGVTLLPGISTTTNMDGLQAFNSGGDVNMFGIGGRAAGDARYDVAFTQPHLAFAFDLESFEHDPNDSSKAGGPGVLTVFFADATSENVNIFGDLIGTPIFVGMVADTAITGVRWAEALENDGGNEETSLDNFRVVDPAATVPEPATLFLLGGGLASLAARRRR